MNAAAAAATAMSYLSIPTHYKHLFLLVPPSRTTHITCGLRDDRRGTLWRSDFLTTEAIQAVHSLKLAKSATQLQIVLKGKLSRLLKSDMLNTLAELQRQNELDLALEVFKQVKKETWYEADPALFSDMIQLLGKNKKFEMAEELFLEFGKDGGEPDTRAYTEMIGVYFRAGMVEKAVELYEKMKDSGCPPDKLTLTIMIRNLEKAGEEALATAVKRECVKFVEYPRKFLAEVGRKYPKRRSLDLR